MLVVTHLKGTTCKRHEVKLWIIRAFCLMIYIAQKSTLVTWRELTMTADIQYTLVYMKIKYNHCLFFLMSVEKATMFAVGMTVLVGFCEVSSWWRVVSLPHNTAQHKMPVSLSHPKGKHTCFLNPILLFLNKWDSHTCSRLELIICDSYSTVNPCGIVISWTSAFCVMYYY